MTYGVAAARFYDLFGSKNDLDFYEELALRNGNEALELGVGTARVAISLAKAGVTVVGIDNSVHMLKAAREKLAKESESVRKRVILKKGDMRDFELKRTFPFIYLPASTFDHNLTVIDRRRTLRCIHKHLEENGTFTMDLEQESLNKPERSWWIDRKEVEDGKVVVRSIFTRKDPARNTVILHLFYDLYKNTKLLERYHEYGEAAIMSEDEITRLLEENGFRIISTYGDFAKSKYTKSSTKIVLTTKKENS